MIDRLALLLATGLFASTAAADAEELRDYCPDRPGLGAPACTIDRGHASFETGLVDWTLDRSRAARVDTLLSGDFLLRYGLGDRSEVQIGWTSVGREIDRDRLTGTRTRRIRTGDVTVALRRNLRNPDGSGLSLAMTPYVTLPVGRQPIGAGDWGAGIGATLSYELNTVFSVALTAQGDAAVDEDGDGRHLAYGAVAGVSAKLNDALTATLEYAQNRDRDPAGHERIRLAGLSMGWQPRDDLQLDIGANGGLNRHAPDVQLYLGVSRRF